MLGSPFRPAGVRRTPAVSSSARQRTNPSARDGISTSLQVVDLSGPEIKSENMDEYSPPSSQPRTPRQGNRARSAMFPRVSKHRHLRLKILKLRRTRLNREINRISTTMEAYMKDQIEAGEKLATVKEQLEEARKMVKTLSGKAKAQEQHLTHLIKSHVTLCQDLEQTLQRKRNEHAATEMEIENLTPLDLKVDSDAEDVGDEDQDADLSWED